MSSTWERALKYRENRLESEVGILKCPKCGKEGKPAVKKVRSKGHEYWYRVLRHPDGTVCVIGRLSEQEVMERRVQAGKRAYELLAATYLIDSLAEEVAEYRKALRAAVEAVGLATRLIEIYTSTFSKIVGGRASTRGASSGTREEGTGERVA